MGDGKKVGFVWDVDSNRLGFGWNDVIRFGISGWGNGINVKVNLGINWGEFLKFGF